jgi:hypothetical protein
MIQECTAIWELGVLEPPEPPPAAHALQGRQGACFRRTRGQRLPGCYGMDCGVEGRPVFLRSAVQSGCSPLLCRSPVFYTPSEQLNLVEASEGRR